MADKKIDFNALAQACDTTWGRASTPKTSSYSVKFTMQGNCLIASYQAVVNFGTEKELILMKRGYSEESISVINAVIRGIKSRYKDICGETLTTKETTSGDSIEIINFGVHNPKRVAYFRRKTNFELT